MLPYLIGIVQSEVTLAEVLGVADARKTSSKSMTCAGHASISLLISVTCSPKISAVEDLNVYRFSPELQTRF